MFPRFHTERRAATILELLVSSTLLLGMLTAAYSIILPMIRTHYRYATRIGLQEELMVAFRKLNVDLQGCTSGGVGLHNPYAPGTPPSMLSCHPITDYTPNASPNDRVPMSCRFDDQIVIYYWLPSRKRLYRHEYPDNTSYPPYTSMGGMPSSTHPDRPGLTAWGQFLSYFTINYSKDRLVAADVVSFEVSSASTRALQFPLSLVIRNQRVGPSGERLSYECKQQLILNNAR